MALPLVSGLTGPAKRGILYVRAMENDREWGMRNE